MKALSKFVFTEDKPALVGREGVKIPLPEPVFHILASIVRAIQEGNSVLIVPETECFTTQAAADFLGVSRPFLIRLLESDKIPHHKTGTHRRIYLKDLKDYQKMRDGTRRKALDELTRKISEAGF